MFYALFFIFCLVIKYSISSKKICISLQIVMGNFLTRNYFKYVIVKNIVF